jgi:hypothetical protein
MFGKLATKLLVTKNASLQHPYYSLSFLGYKTREFSAENQNLQKNKAINGRPIKPINRPISD